MTSAQSKDNRRMWHIREVGECMMSQEGLLGLSEGSVKVESKVKEI